MIENMSRNKISTKYKIITDLDQSDNNQLDEQTSIANEKIDRRKAKYCKLKKYSANFPPKSKSNELLAENTDIEYYKDLVNTKDEQIQKLVQKINDLHIYNDEFAYENKKLQNENMNLKTQEEILSASLDQLQKQKSVCDKCTLNASENENILKTNKSLREDLNMIKILVYRLNVQIERYQDKIRKNNVKINDDQPEPEEVVIPDQHENWGAVNAHTLGPLLNAYDELIKEKIDLINHHEVEIKRFTGNLKEILEENERLQEELIEIRKGKDGWREEKTRLQAQLDTCRTKAELQTRRGDLAKEKLIEVLKCYEQKIQAQSLDMERLQDAYGRVKTELVSCKNLNTQPDAILESWKECQRLFEELKVQYTNDKIKIVEELEVLKKEKNELNEKYLKIYNDNSLTKSQNEMQTNALENVQQQFEELKKSTNKLKESRDRLKARLRIALQWAHKLDDSRLKMKNTWSQLKELETIIRHKEGQIRGLHIRHSEEIEKLNNKLIQRDETIKNILKEKAKLNV